MDPDNITNDQLTRLVALFCASVSGMNSTPRGVLVTAKIFIDYVENGTVPA